jgi:hypothetical protein
LKNSLGVNLEDKNVPRDASEIPPEQEKEMSDMTNHHNMHSMHQTSNNKKNHKPNRYEELNNEEPSNKKLNEYLRHRYEELLLARLMANSRSKKNYDSLEFYSSENADGYYSGEANSAEDYFRPRLF